MKMHSNVLCRIGVVSTIIWVMGLSACGGDHAPHEHPTPDPVPGDPGDGHGHNPGDGHGHHGPLDHCTEGHRPHATNGSIASSWAEYEENGQVDLTVQPTVIEYMRDNLWQDVHVLWHAVRRCPVNGAAPGLPNPCNFPELAPKENECAGPQDGLEFLAMHRHMLEDLQQLWPNHLEQFTGWDEFPATALHYPEQLRPYFRPWSQATLDQAAIADDIENHLEMFPTEGHLGQWFQCGNMSGFLNPNSAANLHFALHFNAYPPNNQTHSVANTRSNIDSYLFWKLHGWIDNVWERYRIAKGLSREDSAYREVMVGQCREMDAWRTVIDPDYESPVPSPVDLPDEVGYFHEVVRPALEEGLCHTCHGAGEHANLRLGYNISSTDIVDRLVNRDSVYAQGYQLVVPGDPESSWLYLKATGASSQLPVTCVGFANCGQPMPPDLQGGMSVDGLNALRQWIENGAEAPIVVSP